MSPEAAEQLNGLLRDHTERKAIERAARESCIHALPEVSKVLYEFEDALHKAGCSARVLEAPDTETRPFSVNPDSPSLTLIVTPNRQKSASAITFACERQGLASWRGACWPLRETMPPDVRPDTKWVEQQILRFLKIVLQD